MRSGLKLLWLPLLGFLLAQCSGEGKRDIRDYYFPLKRLQEGLVYEYRSVGQDSLTPNYWYYRSFVNDKGVFLTGAYYEYDLAPLQFVREELVRNGMLLADMLIYETDSSGLQQQVAVTIEAGNVFPFEVSDSSGIFLYKVRWSPPSDSGAVFTLIKNRRFLGDTTVTIGGERYDCVAFQVRELFEREAEGFFEKEFSGLELYAKGVGLVYYKKEITDNLTLEYQLADRYKMPTLEEKLRRRLDVQSKDTYESD